MNVKTFKGGVHPNGNKEMSKTGPVERYLPKGDLVFPLNQHIGKPAEPVVAKGDQVLAGQLIAKASGFISANIVSSVSGTVKAIEPRVNAMGAKVMSIVIESDGEFKNAPGVGEKVAKGSVSNDDIVKAVFEAGIVGMGGAGFPTNVKLLPKSADAIDYVIANGCECEPYITSDDRLMQDKTRDIVEGLKYVLQLFPNAKGVVAIEENKEDAIRAMQEVCSGEPRITVQVCKTKYPEGGERNLISVITGRDLKLGQLPADLGTIVCNVASLYAINRAVYFQEPLMERYFTISGDAVAEPKTVIAKIGTSVAELLEAAGGVKEGKTIKKALSGGPMMGIAMSQLDVPVCKNNNAVTLLSTDPVEDAMKDLTACIRCGRCAHVCPLHLVPQLMAASAADGDFERYEKIYGLDCIQCGSCTYVCPAKRPLMQLFKQTKATIMAAKRK